jgi:hypothetical protein
MSSHVIGRWALTAVAFLATVGAIPSPQPVDAGAWSPSVSFAAPSTKERSEARKLAGEAMDLFAAGDFDAAHGKFAAANDLVPAPTLQLRMARCLDKLDRLREAAEIYRAVISYELGRSAPAVHKKARKQAVPELAALLDQVPKVVVNVQGPDTTGAVVTNNGEPLAADVLGAELSLDPGVYRFEARVGERVVSETVDLERGATERVALALPMLPEPEGSLGPSGSTPDSAGSSPMVIGGWTAIGIGAVGLIVGAGTGIALLTKESGLEERCVDRACPPEAHADAAEFDRLRITTTVGLVVGGVAGALGTTLLLLSPSNDGDDVGFYVGPFGAELKGRF